MKLLIVLLTTMTLLLAGDAVAVTPTPRPPVDHPVTNPFDEEMGEMDGRPFLEPAQQTDPILEEQYDFSPIDNRADPIDPGIKLEPDPDPTREMQHNDSPPIAI